MSVVQHLQAIPSLLRNLWTMSSPPAVLVLFEDAVRGPSSGYSLRPRAVTSNAEPVVPGDDLTEHLSLKYNIEAWAGLTSWDSILVRDDLVPCLDYVRNRCPRLVSNALRIDTYLMPEGSLHIEGSDGSKSL